MGRLIPLAVAGLLVLGVGLWFLRRRLGRSRKLVFVGGPHDGEWITLEVGRHSVGRSEENDVCLPFEAVSRNHAEIRVRENRVSLWDLESVGGTWVNGERIRTSRLSSGDTVSFADVEMRFEG